MALISKPDYTYIWASGGSVVEPSDTKKQTGWTAEVPPFQWENWIQNRQDQFIAHVNQRGIPQWDGQTEYEAGGLSYVQGSNGVVYKSVAASGPSTTAQDPTTDVSDTYWTVAFADVGAFLTQTDGDNRYAKRSNNLSDLNNIPTARSNLGVQNAVVSGIRGAYLNLSASAVGTNATVTFTADAICVKNASNEQIVLNNVSESCNLLTSGAGGLDAGTIAGNTWYATYVIYNPTTLDVSAVSSLSFTAPTLPSGYTHWAFIEAVRTNSGATQISPINMVNGICYYNPTAGTPIPSDFPIVVSAGTATSLTAISISAYVPPNAKSAILGHNCAGPATGTSRLQMSSATASGLISLATATGNAVSSRIQVEFPNPQVFTPHYQVAGSGTTTVLVEGWRS